MYSVVRRAGRWGPPMDHLGVIPRRHPHDKAVPFLGAHGGVGAPDCWLVPLHVESLQYETELEEERPPTPRARPETSKKAWLPSCARSPT